MANAAELLSSPPSIEMVERRRLQLWSIMIIVMVAVGLAAIAVSGATDNVRWVTGRPLLLAGGVGALAVGGRLEDSACTRWKRKCTSTGSRACWWTSES